LFLPHSAYFNAVPQRGRPALDDSYIEEDMSNFLARLQELAGPDVSDDDADDDPTYDPAHDERVPLRAVANRASALDRRQTRGGRRVRQEQEGEQEEDHDSLLSLSDAALQALDNAISEADEEVNIDDIVLSD